MNTNKRLFDVVRKCGVYSLAPKRSLLDCFIAIALGVMLTLVTQSVCAKIYIIQSGNTLSEIAEAHSVAIKNLVKLNEISDPNKIYVGQKIEISSPQTVKKVAVSKSTAISYEKMEALLPQLKNIFWQEGVPGDYVFLAITESSGNRYAKSSAGAVGLFQLMPATARKGNLRVDYIIDERKDPIKSARVAAQNLKHLYDTFGNWELALSGYNGSFVWQYAKENKTRSYEGFIIWLDKKRFAKKRSIWNSNYFYYKIKEGDMLGKIRAKYKLSKNHKIISREGRKLNPRYLSIGQLVKISIRDVENKQKIYEREVEGILENRGFAYKVQSTIEQVRYLENTCLFAKANRPV